MDPKPHHLSSDPGHDPVDQLLNRRFEASDDLVSWPDYVGLYGLDERHIDALITIACAEDPDDEADVDEHDPQLWAPLRAWRALGQLGAAAAVEPLLGLLARDGAIDDVVIQTDVPKVLGMIGPAALAPVISLLADRETSFNQASALIGVLSQIGVHHPSCREACIAPLLRVLDPAEDWDVMSAGFAVSALIDLHAVETIDAIRQAFERDAVDITIPGDLEDVEIALGMRTERVTPKPDYSARMLKNLAWTSDDAWADGLLNEPSWQEPVRVVKVGRNEACPCGSGKKYKKCCLV